LLAETADDLTIFKLCFTERFLSTVVTPVNDVSFSREKMTSLHFSDADITYVFLPRDYAVQVH